MIVYIPGFWGHNVGSGTVEADVIYRRPRELKSIDAVVKDLSQFLSKYEVEQAVLVGHSFGGLLALKMVELGLAKNVALLFPAMPGNYNQLTPFKLRYFWKSLFGQDNKASFKEWQSWAHLGSRSVAESIYKLQESESSYIISQMALRAFGTWIDFSKVKRNLSSGIIIGSTDDKMCPLRGLATLATRLQVPLSSVTQGHYAHFESRLADLDSWLIRHTSSSSHHLKSVSSL